MQVPHPFLMNIAGPYWLERLASARCRSKAMPKDYRVQTEASCCPCSLSSRDSRRRRTPSATPCVPQHATRRPIRLPAGCIQDSKEYQPRMHADARRCSVLA
jgi:hypothetical protein